MTEIENTGGLGSESNGVQLTESTIKSENAEIQVTSEGGYIKSWKVKNPQTGQFEEILYQGSELKRTGIPTLFPQYSDGEPLPTHGFGRDSSWVVHESEGRTTLRLTSTSLQEQNPEMRANYDHDFETEIEIGAGEDGSMMYTMRVKNLGDKEMPISPGLHPYWAIDHKDKSQITTEGVPGFDASDFDWDKNPPDNPYPFDGKVRLSMPGRSITIEDITESGPVIRNVVAWSQVPGNPKKPDFNFFCLEPVTGLDNAINEDPIKVAPGGEWNMQLRFSADFS